MFVFDDGDQLKMTNELFVLLEMFMTKLFGMFFISLGERNLVYNRRSLFPKSYDNDRLNRCI